MSESKARSEYRRNIITLVTGTTIAQAIPVAISPVLTRLFSPEDFGYFAVYFSTATVLSVIATARYEMAITLPEKDEDARTLVHLCGLIALVFSLFLGIVVLLAKNTLSAWLGVADPTFLLFVPISTFLIGVNQSLYYYANRKKGYRRMATSRVSRYSAYSLGSVVSGFGHAGYPGLVVSDILGLFSSCVVLFRGEGNTLRRFASQEQLKALANRYIDFPRLSLLANLLGKLSSHAPVFLLVRIFVSSTVTGFFALAQRTILTPSDLITRAIADVFRQQASESYTSKGRCDEIFRSTFRRLVLIALVTFPIGYFIVEDAFSFVFGEAWRTAGVYAKIMFPMFFMQFIVSPLSIMFFVAQKQRAELLMQIVTLILILLAFLTGYLISGTAETCLQIFTGAYCVKYVAELLLSYRFSKGSA